MHINCVLWQSVLRVCVLFVITCTCCVYPACLCGKVCCVTRSTLSILEVDMALLSVSRLTCGSWSLDWNIVFADSAHCVLVVLVGCACVRPKLLLHAARSE